MRDTDFDGELTRVRLTSSVELDCADKLLLDVGGRARVGSDAVDAAEKKT